MASCSAYRIRKGVMIPGVSAGSNQVGASEMWTAQVSCPSGLAARAARCPVATIPSAESAIRPRRVRSDGVLPRALLARLGRTSRFLSACPFPPPAGLFSRTLALNSEQLRRDFLRSLRRRVWKPPEGGVHRMRAAWRAQRREKPANSAAAQSSVLAMASPVKRTGDHPGLDGLDLVLLAGPAARARRRPRGLGDYCRQDDDA